MCVWILIWIWLWICTWTYFIQCRNERTQLYRYSGKDSSTTRWIHDVQKRDMIWCACAWSHQLGGFTKNSKVIIVWSDSVRLLHWFSPWPVILTAKLQSWVLRLRPKSLCIILSGSVSHFGNAGVYKTTPEFCVSLALNQQMRRNWVTEVTE
jgi:hypothetical protein